MTSNSGGSAKCTRCDLAENNHTYGRCTAFTFDKTNKKAKPRQCSQLWARCTVGEQFGHQYFDCYRCPDHPGAPPDTFWGTQPDDEHPVLTADAIGVPRPGATEQVTAGASTSQATAAQGRHIAAHSGELLTDEVDYNTKGGAHPAQYHMAAAQTIQRNRTLSFDHFEENLPLESRTGSKKKVEYRHVRKSSNESIDPLQTDYYDDIATRLGNIDLRDDTPSAEDEVWVPTRRNGDIIEFQWGAGAGKKGKEMGKWRKSSANAWVESSTTYKGKAMACLKFKSDTLGHTFCTWEIEGEPSGDYGSGLGVVGAEASRTRPSAAGSSTGPGAITWDKVKVKKHKDGQYSFTSLGGSEVRTAKKDWVKVDGGWTYERRGYIYYITKWS